MEYYNMKENKQHGTIGFPMRYSCADPYEHPYSFVMHWHKGYEIDLVDEGEMTVTIEDRHFDVRPGDLVFIPSGALHSAVLKSCSHECIVFEMEPFANGYEDCAGFYRNLLSGKLMIGPVIPASDTQMQETARKLMQILKEEKAGYREMSVGLLQYLLGLANARGYVSVQTPENMQTNPSTEKLRNVLRYIDEHFTETVLLENLADAAEMSPKYFCEFFKKRTGKKPMEYVNYERLVYARRDLLTTDHSITYTALSSGFNDVSYFIRQFRNTFGIAPGKFRKEYLVQHPSANDQTRLQ